LLDLLRDLHLLHTDLNRLVAGYDTTQWEPTAFTTWKQQGSPTGIFHYKRNAHLLYVCNYDSNLIFTCNSIGEKLKENRSFNTPCGLDIDEKTNLLYVVDHNNVTILNPDLDLISFWELPKKEHSYFRGLKLNNNVLYLTIRGIHQIFLCNPHDGKVLNKWGNIEGGSKQEEFNFPLGLTTNNKYLYLCDSENHRIHVLLKENGQFYQQWGNGKESTEKGQFTYPYCVVYYVEEEIFYIGDNCSVQIFSEDGTCIQRLGDTSTGDMMHQFNVIHGICVWGNRLCVSDVNNERIQIFRKRV